MIRLPNTGTYSLELITAQNGAQSVVSYSDATSSAYTGGTQVASITSATTTTICSTPSASTVRDVDQINIKNTFAGSHTVTVQVDANGTNYPLIVAALLTDESLNYTHGSGWQCLDANGNVKTSPLTAMTSAQLAAILTDETGSGAAVFANGPTLIAPILGTPASGTVTNLTGTASININGTVGATTPAAGTFTTLTSTGNATLGDAEATDTHAIKGATTLLANSASAALTITQTGAGNAFVVEDAASDTTPFVIDANGVVNIGVTGFTSSNLVVASTSEVVRGAGRSDFLLKRANTSITAPTIVASGDSIGQLGFQGYDGAAYITAAIVRGEVDGTPGTNDMPGRLVFSTTADGASSPAERMRIDSSGNVGIGVTANAYTKLGLMGVLPSSSALSMGCEVQADIPATSSGAIAFRTNVATAASAWTLSYLKHYQANLGAIGASSAVTNQYGFVAESSLTGATNNYGFYSNIASGTGRWNFYAAGTADNSFSGNLMVHGAGLVGYTTGSGGTVTQATSRTTGVTINKSNGAITLVSAAGSTAWQSFTVTNSTVAATDNVIVSQVSGTDLYQINVTAIAAGSFRITFATTAGTTTEQPVFKFTVLKGVSA